MAGRKKKDCYRRDFGKLSVKVPWSCFKDILIKDFGFKMENKSGSERVFVREDVRFTAYEPHGSRRGDSFVSKADRKRAIRALGALGLIDEEN